ncbi:hypothetical protein Tco_1225899 [Tanacetum coccineum]
MLKRCLFAANQASVFMEMTSVHISSGLVLHQMTSDHNRLELGIQDHSNEPSSSKLVPKVVRLAVKTATSRQDEVRARNQQADDDIETTSLGTSEAMHNLLSHSEFSQQKLSHCHRRYTRYLIENISLRDCDMNRWQTAQHPSTKTKMH